MKRARSKYIVVLAIMTTVVLGSQMLMQNSIKDSKSDSRIINISGRQRMLSQKMTKASLEMMSADSEIEFNQSKVELNNALKLWSESHNDLKYGSEEIRVDEMNGSRELLSLYEDIEPSYETIHNAASQLITYEFNDLSSASKAVMLKTRVFAITQNEAEFLNIMNRITFQYDKLASAKIEWLSRVEYLLMGLTFFLIVIEVLLIFRPMFKDTKKKAIELNQINELREDENVYASNQIKEANHRIKSLRGIAINLKKELDEKDREYSDKLSEQMWKYTKLLNEYEKIRPSNGGNNFLNREMSA